MSKNLKIFIISLISFFIIFTINNSSAAVNLNLNDNESNSSSTSNRTTNSTYNNDDEDNNTSTNTSNTSSNTPSAKVSSVAESNLGMSNILNILLIVIGTLLILLAIAILIRLKK